MAEGIFPLSQEPTMNLSLFNRAAPMRLRAHSQCFRNRALPVMLVAGGVGLSMLLSDPALAQTATASTAGIGAQAQNMAQEGLTTGGFVAAAAMYVAAFICFIGGVWALWSSRNEQSRTPGKVTMGIAGIALCGLFATGPTWINKAANTASGANATVGTSAQAYQFTGGN